MAPLLNRNFPFVLKVDVVDGSESNVNKFFKKVHFATSRTTSTAKKAYLSQKPKAEDCHYRKVFYFIFFCRQQAFSASCLQVQNSDDENQPENTEGTFSKYRIAYYFPLIGLFLARWVKRLLGGILRRHTKTSLRWYWIFLLLSFSQKPHAIPT